ncbi:MAG: hypothetical protein ACI88L_000299 [Candidatus Paceibacteria bacterium]|jgi:hypothetical protein
MVVFTHTNKHFMKTFKHQTNEYGLLKQGLNIVIHLLTALIIVIY